MKIVLWTGEYCSICDVAYAEFTDSGHEVEKDDFEKRLANKELDQDYRTRAYSKFSIDRTLPLVEFGDEFYTYEEAKAKLV